MTERDKFGFKEGNFTCLDYCRRHSFYITTEDYNPIDIFPLDSLSDHKLVLASIVFGDKHLANIATWNVLNKKYAMEYMQKNENDDNQRLYNHHMASLDKDKQKDRESKVLMAIDSLITTANIDILCLQEVSGELLTALKDRFKDWDIMHSRESIDKNTKVITNCNVIMCDKSKFLILLTDDFHPKGEGACKYAALEAVNNPKVPLFNVMSVHLSWKSSHNYHDKIYSHDFKNRYTFVCGDFNCGVRYPVLGDGKDHLSLYDKKSFRFPSVRGSPEIDCKDVANEGASHWCQYNNVGGDIKRILDKFDHIMMVIPDQDVVD